MKQFILRVILDGVIVKESKYDSAVLAARKLKVDYHRILNMGLEMNNLVCSAGISGEGVTLHAFAIIDIGDKERRHYSWYIRED